LGGTAIVTFLPDGKTEASFLTNSTSSKNASSFEDPNMLSLQERKLDAQQKLVLRLRSGGGQAIWYRPATDSIG